MENPQNKWSFLAGKIIYFYGPFSMAMLNNQRVPSTRYANRNDTQPPSVDHVPRINHWKTIVVNVVNQIQAASPQQLTCPSSVVAAKAFEDAVSRRSDGAVGAGIVIGGTKRPQVTTEPSARLSDKNQWNIVVM